jgi:hypothetical protein
MQIVFCLEQRIEKVTQRQRTVTAEEVVSESMILWVELCIGPSE